MTLVIPLMLLAAVVILEFLGEAGGSNARTLQVIVSCGFVAALVGMVLGRRRARTSQVDVGAVGVTVSRVTFDTGGALWGSGQVTVGTDGVLLVDALGRARFLRHAVIDEIRSDEVGVVLRIEGRTERFPFRRRVRGKVEAHWRAAVGRCIDAARGAGLRGGGSNASLADDPVSLAAIEKSGYRDPAASRDALWALVEDPAAPPGARARAANALRVSGEEVTRLRVAAQAIAEPTLREAIESAACAAEDSTYTSPAPKPSPPRSGPAS